MRVALVHDWLVNWGGAENVLKALGDLFPEADLYTLVDFLPEKERAQLGKRSIQTSFMQKLPFAKKKYRSYLPLMPLAIESFDLAHYDLIISSHHAVAKGVIVGPEQKHICYCHSPMRYAWDMQHEYLRQAGIDRKFRGKIAHYILHKIRGWDVRTQGVDHFIANSKFIQKRIARVYGRSAQVVYPPVNTAQLEPQEKKEDFYLTAARLVPYKRVDVIAEAFAKMPKRKLVIIGSGPELKRIRALATPNIQVLGYQPADVLHSHLRRAKAFVYAAKEDFGILPVEAQACGTPVIAYNAGGAKETVINGTTGLLFNEPSPTALCQAISAFEQASYLPSACRAHAELFGTKQFNTNISQAINEILSQGTCLIQ